LTAFSPSGIPVAELFFLCPLLIPSETVFLYLIQPITKKKKKRRKIAKQTIHGKQIVQNQAYVTS